MSGAQLVAVGFGAAFAATGVGAPVGFLIGSIVGNMLFPPKAIRTEGPRLGDLTVSSSSYGAPRAIGFGTKRMAGNMIWSAGIRERKNTQKVSGKGSMSGVPDQKQTTYSYFASFTMAFGEGPAAECLRIWANSKLVFDKRSTTLNMKKAGLNFRFYPGSEDQLPDPSMIAKDGEENTPAYRGTVLLVFDDLPLGDFGNRIPNIEAEIAYDTSATRFAEISTDLVGGTATSWQLDDFAVDWERGFVYAVDMTTDSSFGHLRKFRLSDLQEVQQVHATTALVQGPSGTAFRGDNSMCLPNGDLIMTINEKPSSGNSLPIVRLDGSTLREKQRFGAGSSTLNYRTTEFEATSRFAPISLFGFNGREDYVLCGSIFNSIGVLNVTAGALSHVWNTDTFEGGLSESRVRSICGGRIFEGQGDGYAMAGSNYNMPSSIDVNIYRIRVTSGATMTAVGAITTYNGVDFERVLTLTPDDLFPGETTLKEVGGLVYSRTDDTILFWAKSNGLAETRWFKYDPNTGTQEWRTEPIASGVLPNDDRFGAYSRVEDDTFGYSIGNNGVLIDLQTGELLINDTAPNYDYAMGNGLGGYDSRTETFVGPASGGETSPIIRHFFRRVTAADANVGAVIKALANRVGLADADLDTTGIDHLTVPGYVLGRQTSARAAILPLAQTFLFDGVESDDKLKFIERGGDSVRTITQSELAPLSGKGDLIKVTRAQEVELPVRFSMVYLDKDKDYQQNEHHTKRIQEPTPAMRSDNEMAVEFPGALSSTVAKQQTEKIMYTTWTERNNYEAMLPWTHLDLDPGDVVTLALDNGTNLRCRIGQADVGVNLGIAASLIGEEANQFVSTVLGDSGSGVPSQAIRSSVYVLCKLLDIPLLRDADEVPSRVSNPVYAVMGTAQEGAFLAGTLHKSSDNQIFEPVQFFVSEMNWGATLNALGDPGPGELWAMDETNTLTVRVMAGSSEMVSVTQAELLNGANAAALIKSNGEVEVIQYRDVEENADGSFTLSNLLRGRRGTDTMVNDHEAGETFIMLVPADVEKFILNLGDRNQQYFYKSVGSGQIFEDGELQTFTSAHRALMPYAVAQVAAAPGASNSIDFSWVRRTRVGGQLQDSFGVVPISEDSEEYELEIYDGPGGTLVRTVTGLTDPEYNYSSADQITDGFTPPLSSVTIKVFQISAQVGRGFSREENLNVE